MSRAAELLAGPAHALSDALRRRELSVSAVVEAAADRVQATDGQVNATVPSGKDPTALSLEDALELIAQREEKLREQGRDPRAEVTATGTKVSKKRPVKAAAAGDGEDEAEAEAPAAKKAGGKKAAAAKKAPAAAVAKKVAAEKAAPAKKPAAKKPAPKKRA